MIFAWQDGGTSHRIFGDVVRGLTRNGERPLNCYINPHELENANLKEPLPIYLFQIIHCLQPGGQVVLK